MKFCSGGIPAATRVKMSDSEKRVNKNTSDIPSIKRVTRKFLEVSRNSRAKQRQRKVSHVVTHQSNRDLKILRGRGRLRREDAPDFLDPVRLVLDSYKCARVSQRHR